MANQLDLEEQEQLDQLKHFWNQYGNFISWALIVVLGAFAAWNTYQYWQRSQSEKASAMFDAVESVVRAGDVPNAERAFNDMRSRFPHAIYSAQAGLMLAQMAYEAGKPSVASAALTWVADDASDKGYASVARLRLAGMLMDTQKYDEALAVLDKEPDGAFAGLASDRKGDVLRLQAKLPQAIAAYQQAYKSFDAHSAYRRIVAVKLTSLGVDVRDAGALGAAPATLTEGTK